jgi:tetratricopeptide (TPR) repeat protein
VLGLGELAEHPDTVAATWALSLARAQGQAPAAADLLALWAYLAPDDVPRSLATEHAKLLPTALQRAVADRLAYNQVLSALGRYSLVTASHDSLAVHRLVQGWVRARLDHQTQQHWAGIAVRLLGAAFPANSGDVQVWPRCARLLPHALAAADHASSLAAEPETTAELLTQAGIYLWWRAEHRQARQLFEQALAILQVWFGPDHPFVAATLNNLGNVLRGHGELGTARTLYQRALAIFEARLGPRHPDLARSLNNLAATIGAMGELQAARDAHQRAQAILEAQLGPNHPDVARSLDNLGMVLRRLGELDAARDAHQRALAMRQARVEPDHPHVAHSLSNLGSVLYQHGALAAARTHYQRALAIFEARLGPDHPDRASALANLGNVLHIQGELPAARSHYERALVIFAAQFEPDHPDIAQTQQGLQGVLVGSGEGPPPAAQDQAAALLPFEARVGAGNPLATTLPRNRFRGPASVRASTQAPTRAD